MNEITAWPECGHRFLEGRGANQLVDDVYAAASSHARDRSDKIGVAGVEYLLDTAFAQPRCLGRAANGGDHLGSEGLRP